MTAFFTVLANISTILGLVKTLDDLHTNADTDHTVEQNLKKLQKALDAKDLTQLDDMFNAF